MKILPKICFRSGPLITNENPWYKKLPLNFFDFKLKWNGNWFFKGGQWSQVGQSQKRTLVFHILRGLVIGGKDYLLDAQSRSSVTILSFSGRNQWKSQKFVPSNLARGQASRLGRCGVHEHDNLSCRADQRKTRRTTKADIRPPNQSFHMKGLKVWQADAQRCEEGVHPCLEPCNHKSAACGMQDGLALHNGTKAWTLQSESSGSLPWPQIKC